MNKGRLIVADSEKNADMLYASSFQAPDDFVWFECNGKQYLVLSKLEIGRARLEAADHLELLEYDAFFAGQEKCRSINELIVRISEEYSITSWTVPKTFPLHIADTLRANSLKVKAVSELFFPEREVKSEEEINHIAHAVAITEQGMARAHEVLSESTINEDLTLSWNGQILTSELIRAEIEVTLIRQGAVPFSTIVACGTDSAEPHNAGSGPIQAHQPIVIDIFPRVTNSGYWGDMTRTFVKGTPSSVVQQAFDAVKQARDTAKQSIKAGVTGAHAHSVAFNVLEQSGFETKSSNGVHCGFIHGLGHGVGLEIHEAPRVSPHNPSALAENTIITVEPGLYYAEWGGIRLEDIGVVRKDSFQCFNSFPTELVIP